MENTNLRILINIFIERKRNLESELNFIITQIDLIEKLEPQLKQMT